MSKRTDFEWDENKDIENQNIWSWLLEKRKKDL